MDDTVAGPALPRWAIDLDLTPHPEGGFFTETWRSPVRVPAEALPADYHGDRCTATAILFLLLPGQQSAWHVVRSPELWLAHRGSVALELGGQDDAGPGQPTEVRVGTRFEDGERPQGLVPAGCWQRARPLHGEPALISCLVSPGFEFADFRLLPAPQP